MDFYEKIFQDCDKETAMNRKIKMIILVVTLVLIVSVMMLLIIGNINKKGTTGYGRTS